RDVKRAFVSRIARQVLMETGIRYSTPWTDIKRTLKERYAGAKKPLARDTLEILRMQRRPSESAAEFAERMGEKARVLRKKIQEGIENAQVAQITGAVIDELLRESLAQQVPVGVCGAPSTAAFTVYRRNGSARVDGGPSAG
ncbi:hypothetical protein, partial [Klebsiella pneumoniae]|uniref:hypothetical protein n=1 Tax=Klebsiella pneumoniae TaxID=573 RepID=UPI004055425D